ncbi:MAG: cysteine desulfurase [Elusimicrobia bacterium]|nr:cysteine desulfurase [Elusimicrobiota bacterium]
MKETLSSTLENKNSKLDILKVRADFPLIAKNKVIYLDNAATTQKPKTVIQALTNFYENSNANIHRGVYRLSEEATEAYESIRKKVARFVGAQNGASSIVFTRNATEAVNLVAYAWGEKFINAGDEIILTEMEHHSNIVPWQLLTQRKKAKVKYVPYDPGTGKPQWEALSSLMTERTKLVAFTHVSNSLGTINPVQEVIRSIRKLGSPKILIDGAQGVPHLPAHVDDWGCDFLVFSAHKMLGPTGIGVLWAKKEILEAMEPFLGGGDMIKEVSLETARWNDVPWKFEAGTPNVADVIAFGPAIDYLEKIGLAAIGRHEQELTRYALGRLEQTPGITLYGTKTAEERCGVVSFNIQGVHPHDSGTLLARENIAVRVGHHCNMPLMKKLGIMGTTRASFYLYNTLEEVDALIRAIPKIQKIFS